MNSEIKKLWVAALRSGDYKQGKLRLRNPYKGGQTSFCCLGVLCNLHAIAHPEIAKEEKDEWTYMGEGGVLPAAVSAWAGLTKPCGDDVTIETINTGLAGHNDLYERNFLTLAKAIEEQL